MLDRSCNPATGLRTPGLLDVMFSYSRDLSHRSTLHAVIAHTARQTPAPASIFANGVLKPGMLELLSTAGHGLCWAFTIAMHQHPTEISAQAQYTGNLPAQPTAEILLEYRMPFRPRPGRLYIARAWGGRTTDRTRRWHGWIEFVPLGGGVPLRTASETTQPNRKCTVYWATGLGRAYLQGALRRASPVATGPLTIGAPECPFELTLEDRRFLKSIGIGPGAAVGLNGALHSLDQRR